MSRTYSKYFWILPVIWMFVIFMFSNQPSYDSSQLSGEVTKIIEAAAEFLHIDTTHFDLHLFIRKTAHFTEFAVLGLLLFIAIYPSKKAVVKAGLLSQLAGMGYAVSDEIHQIFIPGRSCQIKDMLIDSSGVLLAVLICTILSAVKVKNKRRQY